MQEKQHVFRVSEWRMLIIFTIMVLVLSIASDGVFLKKSNIINLFAQNAIVGVITIGQFLVIVSGGIDLTVGSTVAITSIMYVLFQEMGLAFSIVLAVIIGILIGIINGLTVTKMKIIPFIATLITMGIVRGFAFLVVNGRVIYDIKPIFLSINKMKILSIPLLVYIWILLAVIWIIILKYTKIAVNLYSTGGNEFVAKLSGVNTDKVKVLSYVCCGALCGISGILYTGRFALADPNTGINYGMDSITAVVIGGASLAGGEGKLSNAILGVLILGMLNNFMNIVGIPSAMHVGIKGFILVITVLLYNTDIYKYLIKRRNRNKLLGKYQHINKNQQQN